MPRVLMLAHWFPPCARWPTAARRAEGFARHLPSHGWDPLVIAPDLGAHGLCTCGADHGAGMDGIEVRRRPLPPSIFGRRGEGTRDQVGQDPTMTRGRRLEATARSLFESRGQWLRSASAWARAELARGDFAAVWTTSGPSSSALVGWRLKRQGSIAWVADLRDPISDVILSPHAHPLPQRVLRRAVIAPALRRADVVTAASHASADLDANLLGRPVHPIYSGTVLPDDPSAVEPDRTDGVTLVLVGALYEIAMRLDILLEGLAKAMTPVRLHYFGADGAMLLAKADRSGVASLVQDHGRRPRAEVVGWMRAADAQVLLEYTTGATRIPGRVFEMAATGGTVLAVPGANQEIRQVLDPSANHVPCPSASVLAGAINHLPERQVEHRPTPHTPQAAAARLAQLLDDVTVPRP